MNNTSVVLSHGDAYTLLESHTQCHVSARMCSNVNCLIYCRAIYSWVNVSGVLWTEQSNCLHCAQLRQVKGHHEVRLTRSLSNLGAGSQFSYEGASL